jgi:hypothetical protein
MKKYITIALLLIICFQGLFIHCQILSLLIGAICGGSIIIINMEYILKKLKLL